MKNYKLLLGSAFLSGMFMFSASMYLKNNIPNNLRTNNEKAEGVEDEQDASGADQWLFDIQKNQLTGQIDELDVIKAREEGTQMMKYRSPATLGLEWNELGPDNVGGRTRAILFDKNNPTKIFAGGASGGLWVSTNSGSTWSNVPGFDQQPNLGITCITQAANGDIYAGTGEDLSNGFTGTPGQSFIGSGIYKSTDDGATFTLLPSTIPATPNSTGNSMTNKFLGVNNLVASPTNPSRIYAATRYGLQMTNDGGVHWLHPIRTGTTFVANTARSTDVSVASDGTVIACINGRAYLSATGDSATWAIIPNAAGLPTSGVDRLQLAFAPSDPNYIYASADKTSPYGKLLAVYQSTDKGVTWTNIGTGGSAQFDPLGNQGWYAQVLAVYPMDKTKIVLGGLDTWTWKQANPNVSGVGQWNQASKWFYTPPSQYFVHADIHTIKFSPANPNVFYVGCDGGIFRGYDDGTSIMYQAMNFGYNVTQFYSIAFAGDDPSVRAFIGGAQDNGTNYVSGYGNTPKTAEAIDGGDGAKCEISFLNPNVSFSTVYFGALARHSTKGGAGSSFYSTNITSLAGFGTQSFASFVTPISLYETKTATNSPDSVRFINGAVSQILTTGNGVMKRYTGKLNLPQLSASFVPDSIVITCGLKKVKDDGLGTLTGDVDIVQANTINYATGQFDFYFNSPPANGAPVNATFYVSYAIGSNITISRTDYVSPLIFTATSIIKPNDTVKVYDPFQAKLAVGFSGHVYMTKGCLNFSGIPTWFHIGTISGTTSELAWSADGDILYVGTDGGVLYRFSNMAAIKDYATGDIASPSCVVLKTQIAGFGGRYITGISVDPSDANKVAVSLGNYGNTAYIYYSSTAVTCASSPAPTPNFSLKQGTGSTKLPAMPAYSVLIEKNNDLTNPNRVIVGTEYGIYSTPDITAANPDWSFDNGVSQKLPNVPVFQIRQQRRDGTEVYNPYVIYAGTHGRGAWKSETYKGIVTVGINEPGNSHSAKQESGISIYPNPMTESGTIAFNLASTSNVVISIYSLQGKLVKSIKSGLLVAGEQKIEINTAELSKGTYLVSIDGSAVHATSKFVVVK